MFCPKCKSVYRSGYTVCPECNCDLIDALDTDNADNTDENINPVLLCEAADDFEAEIILAKLKSENVYAFKKYRGSDSYNMIFLGRAILGVEIWVSDKDIEKANDILAAK